jgi:hypothetical protein
MTGIVAHLLVSARGPATECRTSRAKFGVSFKEFHFMTKAGEATCERCAPAYRRRLAAVQSRKADKQ